MNSALGSSPAETIIKIYDKIPKLNDFIETVFNLQIEHGS
jgi:hypothetical protein